MVVIFAVSIFAVAIAQDGDASSSATATVRSIPYSTEPIPPRLRTDDEVVVVERDDEGVVFEGSASVDDEIRFGLANSAVVAVFRVQDVDTILVEDQTWIHTRVFAEIDHLLAERTTSISAGQRFEIHGGGGEMKIGRVLVKAGRPLKVEPERRYLMFLHMEQATGVWFPTNTPLLVEEKLSNPWQSEGGSKVRDPLHGLALPRVIELIRRHDKPQ